MFYSNCECEGVYLVEYVLFCYGDNALIVSLYIKVRIGQKRPSIL